MLRQYVKDSIGLDISYMEHMKPVALQTLLSTQNYVFVPMLYLMKTAL
jgi:hypothetical protein